MPDLFNWKIFVNNLSRSSIVPIIGNDLSIIRLPKSILQPLSNYKQLLASGIEEGELLRVNLYKYLSYKLWDIFGNGEIDFPVNLNHVIQKLQGDKKYAISENDINLTIRDEITKITNDQILFDPYIQLIRLNGFDNFVSVNIDNFLERAFDLDSIQVNKSFNFSIPFLATDHNEKRDPAIPNIFNLMGSARGSNFALSDEDSLEYIYLLQNGADTIAKDMFDAINKKNLLFIGSSFPDWCMRFFIRIISNERFKNNIKTKYVACDSAIIQGELRNFLENYATKVIPIGACDNSGENAGTTYKNSIEFINEMTVQCNLLKERIRNEAHYKETVFISYSWSDKAFAERLRNEFERQGINVFFDDQELKTGDRYNQIIKKYLKDSDFFLPLISENSISDPTKYVYSKEWNNAIFLNDERNYIRPYIIDETKPVDQRIPEEIRNLKIVTINSIDAIGDVTTSFIKDNKLTPIAL